VAIIKITTPDGDTHPAALGGRNVGTTWPSRGKWKIAGGWCGPLRDALTTSQNYPQVIEMYKWRKE